MLNRYYKPLGGARDKRVDYNECSDKIYLRLTPRGVSTLSWNGDANPDEIFFYNDGCIPFDNTAATEAYFKRLEALSNKKIFCKS